MTKDPTHWYNFDEVKGGNFARNGDHIFIDVIGTDNGQPVIRLECRHELAVNLISTIVGIDKKASQERYKHVTSDAPMATSVLEATNFDVSTTPLGSAINLTLHLHNGFEFPLSLSRENAEALAERLQSQVAEAQGPGKAR